MLLGYNCHTSFHLYELRRSCEEREASQSIQNENILDPLPRIEPATCIPALDSSATHLHMISWV